MTEFIKIVQETVEFLYKVFRNSAKKLVFCIKTDDLTIGTIPKVVPTLNSVFKYFSKKTPNFNKENKKDFYKKVAKTQTFSNKNKWNYRLKIS